MSPLKHQVALLEGNRRSNEVPRGFLDSNQLETLVLQASKASDIDSDLTAMTLSTIFENGVPMDNVEAMMMAHLTTLHNHLMHFLHRLAVEEGKSDWDERMDAEMNRVAKIHKQFIKTVDALLHYRNKGYNRFSIEAKSNG